MNYLPKRERTTHLGSINKDVIKLILLFKPNDELYRVKFVLIIDIITKIWTQFNVIKSISSLQPSWWKITVLHSTILKVTVELKDLLFFCPLYCWDFFLCLDAADCSSLEPETHIFYFASKLIKLNNPKLLWKFINDKRFESTNQNSSATGNTSGSLNKLLLLRNNWRPHKISDSQV